MNDRTKNKVQYILYEPELVGWDKALAGVINDAKRFSVPVAVKTQILKELVEARIALTLPDIKIKIIVIEER